LMAPCVGPARDRAQVWTRLAATPVPTRLRGKREILRRLGL
jgi:hypothetical protein